MPGGNEWEQPEQEFTHEQLVDEFHDFLNEWQKQLGKVYTPSEIVRKKLELESQMGRSSEKEFYKQRTQFFFTLLQAWDILAYDTYPTGSLTEELAGIGLEARFYEGHEESIKLSPRQVLAIDALAEVVGIPHHKGQKELPIPEKLKNYAEYQMSPEYQTLRAKEIKKRKEQDSPEK